MADNSLRAKPFPFALYPTLLTNLVVLVGGIIFLLGNWATGSSLTGKAPVISLAGSIDASTEAFTKYSEIENFQRDHSGVWKAMKDETSFNSAQRDSFAALTAILEKDEATLLKITKRYTKVDFLPAYLLGAKKPDVQVIVKYAQDNGAEQAIAKLMQEKEGKDDKADVWPYRATLLDNVGKKIKYRKELAQEVWDSCAVSRDSKLYVTFPDTGPIAKRALAKLEDPSTAGPPVVVKGLDGEPLLDVYGQQCVMREAYAKELEQANKCVFDKSKHEIVPRYCYRSAQMQAVVRSSIKRAPLHKCKDNEEAGALDGLFRGIAWVSSGGGGGMAAPPGVSNHQWAAAIDLNTPRAYLEECLPPYWAELKGDPGHWDAIGVPKPKEGNCTTVKLRGGKTRPFCFYQEKKEGAESEEVNELPEEGTYERVPEGEITKDDLVRVKATPEIVAMSVKIQDNEFRHISVEELLDGAWHVFRYEADGLETFCKVEAHNNHKARGFVGWAQGQKSARAALYNQGCSTYRRKQPK